MKSAFWAVLPAFVLVVPASAATSGQDDKSVANAEVGQVEAVDPAKACKKGKKKGAGGLLRAARSSGLISVFAGKAGTGGALVNSAANTAIDVADAAERMAPPPERPKC